jgi:DNA excision repair protein ERCC-1
MRDLCRLFKLRVLLLSVDITSPERTINELSKAAVINQLTVMLAWSPEEAARYLETYKVGAFLALAQTLFLTFLFSQNFENKPPDQLQEKVAQDYVSQLAGALGTVRGVNKTDAVTLMTTFGCMKDIMGTRLSDLRLCPGFGETKAERLHRVFNQPFVPESIKKTKPNRFTATAAPTTTTVRRLKRRRPRIWIWMHIWTWTCTWSPTVMCAVRVTGCDPRGDESEAGFGVAV